MTSKKFGYVRVSSKDQNEERQIINLKNIGIDERDIFIDKQSGKTMDRENYQYMKKFARTGDTIVFDSLTRLGRTMVDILDEFRYYEEHKINLQFLKEPFINVTYNGDATNDVIQSAIQKATATILSAFAEKERVDINKRQAEGIAAAQAQGKHLGRPQTQITQEFIDAYNEWKKGKITARNAMKKSNIPSTTFYRLVKRYEGGK
ncbi:recombinase family protein (plasmid) [Bacillus sp. RA(2023)]|uniref:Integrase n=3 Tax=Bacillus cereus group TaxID=86661 RepID=A0A9X6QN47_BACTU|nr:MULTISPECIES: recombinase family protein [Bacillus]HDR5352182.1 recombinase family protein [Bacillus thuringiensis]MDA2101329.1 recombinase family protein [Bacillus cereus]MDA2106938.1 recombinase family protein [Bacillus cereus]MEB8992069.1 recombinase family protein [Bacillus cereus]MEB9180111.1 recombinase family protein [Bacillus cereus]